MSTKWVVTSLVALVSLLHRNGHAVAAIGVSLLTALFGKIMKAGLAVGRPAAFVSSSVLLRGWRLSSSGYPVPLPRLSRGRDDAGIVHTELICGVQDPVVVRNVGDERGERRSVKQELLMCDHLDLVGFVAGPSADDVRGIVGEAAADALQVPAEHVATGLVIPVIVAASALSAWRIWAGLHTPAQVSVGALLGSTFGVFGHWAATAERGIGRMVDTWMRGGDPWSLGTTTQRLEGSEAPPLGIGAAGIGLGLVLVGLALVGSIERTLCPVNSTHTGSGDEGGSCGKDVNQGHGEGAGGKDRREDPDAGTSGPQKDADGVARAPSGVRRRHKAK